MKVAVIGANGQLGTDIVARFAQHHQVVALTHDDIEITDIDNVNKILRDMRPDLVINTAAFHNVPVCEQQPEQAFRVNAIGALNLARVSTDLNSILVHFSTDYVFDGKKKSPYLESDCTHPLNIYGLTKLDGETLIQNHAECCFVIRVSGIYGKTPCRAKGGNFVMTMLRLARERPEVRVVDDEVLTPTAVDVIAENTFELVQTEAFGLYHMTCQKSCSWYEFARVIFDELQLKTPLSACSSDAFPSSVKRPSYSVLDNHKLRAIELDRMPHWREALVNFLKNYVNNS